MVKIEEGDLQVSQGTITAYKLQESSLNVPNAVRYTNRLTERSHAQVYPFMCSREEEDSCVK